MLVAVARLVRWRVLVLAWAFSLGLLAVVLTASVSEPRPSGALVATPGRGSPERVVVVFIDSLARDVATDAHVMPELAELARQGASFDVEPCRDQLTYLCLRAALTGHDDSSLLAVADPSGAAGDFALSRRRARSSRDRDWHERLSSLPKRVVFGTPAGKVRRNA